MFDDTDKRLTGPYDFSRRRPKRGARKKVHGGSPTPSSPMITEDGDNMITEDGDQMITE